MARKDIKKFALLSHILPPSSSGQAVVLYRLLSGMDPDSYVLISSAAPGALGYDKGATKGLGKEPYTLKASYQVPAPGFLRGSKSLKSFNAQTAINKRASQIEEIIKKEGVKVLVACTGDLYDLPAASLAAKRSKIDLIPYIFDDYIYQWRGANRKLAQRAEPGIMENVALVIVPNEFTAKEYESRYRVKSTVIHNPCPMPDIAVLDKAENFFSDDTVNIVYTGAVYHAHYDAFQNLIKALELTSRKDIKLHIFTAQQESDLEVNNIAGAMVEVHPHIEQEKVVKVLRDADILFLPLAFNSPIKEVIRTSAPGKLGEYLSVGRPVLVHAPKDSFVSWYFRENKCGVVVDIEDVDLLTETISNIIGDATLRSDISACARAAAEKDFSVEKMKKKFEALLSAIN